MTSRGRYCPDEFVVSVFSFKPYWVKHDIYLISFGLIKMFKRWWRRGSRCPLSAPCPSVSRSSSLPGSVLIALLEASKANGWRHSGCFHPLYTVCVYALILPSWFYPHRPVFKWMWSSYIWIWGQGRLLESFGNVFNVSVFGLKRLGWFVLLWLICHLESPCVITARGKAFWDGDVTCRVLFVLWFQNMWRLTPAIVRVATVSLPLDDSQETLTIGATSHWTR